MLTMRPLLQESVGGMLRRLRKTQGISLDMLAERTCLQRKHIEAMERDAYNDVPDMLTARRMLLQLVEVLGADKEYVLTRFHEECGSCPTAHTLLRLPRQKTVRKYFTSWSRLMLWTLGGVLTIATLSFIGLRAQALLGAPALLIDSPNTDTYTTAVVLDLGGQTDPGVQVTVNGEQVFPDPTGRFSTRIPLRAGYNELLVEAHRKFGRSARVIRRVFLETSSMGSAIDY